MKILFILHTPPPVHGASIMGQYIKESELINNSFQCRYINLGTSYSIREIGKGGIGKIFRYFNILWQVFDQIVRFKPDMCYLAITAKGPGFYKDFLVAFIIKLLGKKPVYHFHNKGVSTRQDKLLDNLLYKFVFKNAEVILLSEYLYSDIQKYVPKERVHYCPNGIPKAQSSKPGALSNPARILFLSNLIESKGVFVLLEACKILQNKHLDFYCTFIGGEGDLTVGDFQQKVQELELENHVQYAGEKYGNEKEESFAQADIFAFPTYYEYECFPLVILEGMQYNLPILSTYEGAIPGIVGNNKTGFLVPQKNVDALAEKLEILIGNSELRMQMGSAGRTRYEKEFTLPIFENRLKVILITLSPYEIQDSHLKSGLRGQKNSHLKRS